MFQALEGALLIKSPIFKQMLFPVCSCKFYSRVFTIFYQSAYSWHTTYLGSGKEALKPCSAKLMTQAATSGVQSSTNLATTLQVLYLSAAIYSRRRHRYAP